MAMDHEAGKMKMFNSTDEIKKTQNYNVMPQVGEVVRFEGTPFCFRIHRIDPKKVILKPVPASEYHNRG